jgi:hypothetical protein
LQLLRFFALCVCNTFISSKRDENVYRAFGALAVSTVQGLVSKNSHWQYKFQLDFVVHWMRISDVFLLFWCELLLTNALPFDWRRIVFPFLATGIRGHDIFAHAEMRIRRAPAGFDKISPTYVDF